MMQQRMATVLCLPVFCLAVWALSSSVHAAGDLPPAPPAVDADEAAVPEEGDEDLVQDDEDDDVFAVAPECRSNELTYQRPGARGCIGNYRPHVFYVCDTRSDGDSAYMLWNYGQNITHTPTNRLEIGGNGKCSSDYVSSTFKPGTIITFRVCRNVDPGFDDCTPWNVLHFP